MKLHTTSNIVQGQVAVHRTVAELLMRNVVPYFPTVDEGIDLIAGANVKLQIKSTLRHSQNYRMGGWWCFTLSNSQRIRQRRYVPCSSRKFSAQCDFVVLHAVEANRFWIVPAHVLDGRFTVQFKDGNRQWRDIDVNAARRMREQGYTYKAIADAIGATWKTIKNRLDGSFTEPKRKYADLAQYENRWDLITGALATLHEANTIAETPREATIDRDAFLQA